MQIRKPTLAPSPRMLLCALGATVSIALSACGQTVAAQTIAPADDGRVVMAAATAAATASAQPTATAAPIATATPQAEIEFSGVLGGVGNRTVTIDGKTVTTVGAEVHGTLTPGATVKVHAVAAADGSLTAREIELLAAPAPAATQTAGDNANHDVNDDHGVDSATHDVNDDHGADNATHDVNDDHGADNATHDVNDDHGGSGGSSNNDSENSGSGHGGRRHNGKDDGKGHH